MMQNDGLKGSKKPNGMISAGDGDVEDMCLSRWDSVVLWDP